MRLRRSRAEREARRRQLAVVIVIAIVAATMLLVTAFGSSDHPASALVAPASASRLLPAGPPAPEVIARIGTLHLQLPVNQHRVTAIGYAAGTDGALALAPVGRQANEGLVKRLWHSIVGGGGAGPRWYQLPGGAGPPTSSLDVGASVTASGSKLGQVLDFSKVEKQALARHTNDAGNHILVEVHPAATLQLP